MLGNSVLGILFGYVHEERIRTLTANRAMGSIPFGGRYRLVDFPLSNMVNAGINKVGIITEQNYQSLMDHLGSGKAWDLSRKREGLYLLPPFGANITRNEGKLESLASIKRFIKNSFEEYVLISDCDVVANIDYRAVFEAHSKSKADITVVYRRGRSPDTDRNVIYTMDPESVVQEIYIKRGFTEECNYGLGMYLMRKELLSKLIDDCMSRNLYDFDRDLIQRNLLDLRICGYEFTGTGYVISDFYNYFTANMALMEPKVREQLFNPARPIYTKVRDDMPARYGLGSDVSNSIIADGCIIEGEVENSVLFRGVTVKKGAKLKNCVIMQDSVVGEYVRLEYVVADKNVIFGKDKAMMGYHTYPIFIAKGSKV